MKQSYNKLVSIDSTTKSTSSTMAHHENESSKSMKDNLDKLHESVATIIADLQELKRDHFQDIDDLAQRVSNCEINEADLEKRFIDKLKNLLLESRMKVR